MASTTIPTRVFNFSAGPAVLPLSVLETVQQELLCLPGAGASILEISHRSNDFVAILERAQQNLKKLLQIPENYKILFLQGGSRLQFSMIPMNLLRGTDKTADYILTGSWGKKAFAEAQKEGNVNVSWDGQGGGYREIPAPGSVTVSPDSAYVYFTSNETIEGVQFRSEPDCGDAPLVCDASSDFLHRPLDIRKYGVLYACAQKNAGPAGVTVVIIREDLLAPERTKTLPGYCDFSQHVAANSMFNTPPTFSIYVMNLVFEWLLGDIGGLDRMLEINREKAAMLYEQIDASNGFYQGHASPECRSLMNVTFRLPNDELQEAFVQQAAARNLCNLKGHRSVGGIRASIYNAMPIEGVQGLRDFMAEFRETHASSVS